MTSEKLAEFRSKGMLLDPKFDRLAVIGDKRKENENDKIKTLSIKFISCSADDKNYNLTLEVSATNLKSNKAKIYVGENEVFGSEEAVTKNVEINPNGKQNINASFSKDKEKEFSNSILEGDFEFIAEISCDELSRKYTEFKLKCEDTEKKDECKKVKVPAINLKNNQKAKFISTVLSETNLGSEYLKDIGWVYYNRVRIKGFDAGEGMKASSAYRLKHPNYKLCLYYLGLTKEYAGVGKEYASFKYSNVILSKYIKENGWFVKKIEPNIKKMKSFIEKEIFSSSPETCYKDWIGQGYWADLDMNPDDKRNKDKLTKWYEARQYYWLQLQGKVKIKYVHIMRDGNATSFIFDEVKIKEVFKLNPKLLSKPEHVKKFNTENGLNFDL